MLPVVRFLVIFQLAINVAVVTIGQKQENWWLTDVWNCDYLDCFRKLIERRKNIAFGLSDDEKYCLDWPTDEYVSPLPVSIQLQNRSKMENPDNNNRTTKCLSLNPRLFRVDDSTYCLRAQKNNQKINGNNSLVKEQSYYEKKSAPKKLIQCGTSDQSKSISIDHRIACRPRSDTMQWYRGRHSVTVRMRRCFRWDSPIIATFHRGFSRKFLKNLTSFEQSGGAGGYPGDDLLPKYSRSLALHENYCRNPDDSPNGPWCFTYEPTVTNLTEIINFDPINASSVDIVFMEPCFNVCLNYASPQFCLPKPFFPWHIRQSYNFSLSHRFTVLEELEKFNNFEFPPPESTSEELTENVIAVGEDDLELLSEVDGFLWLNDMLSVPRLVSFEQKNLQNRPMINAETLASFMYDQRYSAEWSSRLVCFQTGEMTALAGPWIYTVNGEDETRKIYEKRRFSQVKSETGKIGLASHDRLYKFGLWQPCFLACQDAAVRCYPSDDFPYYGPRDVVYMDSILPHSKKLSNSSSKNLTKTQDGGNFVLIVKCRPFNTLFEMVSLRLDGMRNSTDNREFAKLRALYILFTRDFCFQDSSVEGMTRRHRQATCVKNLFAQSFGYRLASSTCLNLGRFFLIDLHLLYNEKSRMKRLKATGERSSLVKSELLDLIILSKTVGPACFVSSGKSGDLDSFTIPELKPCFDKCPKNSPEPKYETYPQYSVKHVISTSTLASSTKMTTTTRIIDISFLEPELESLYWPGYLMTSIVALTVLVITGIFVYGFAYVS